MDIRDIVCNSWKCANDRGHVAAGISNSRQFLGNFVGIRLNGYEIKIYCMQQCSSSIFSNPQDHKSRQATDSRVYGCDAER